MAAYVGKTVSPLKGKHGNFNRMAEKHACIPLRRPGGPHYGGAHG
jgi:hypothetical protein